MNDIARTGQGYDVFSSSTGSSNWLNAFVEAFSGNIQAGWTSLVKGDLARNAPDAPTNHHNVNYFHAQTQMRL